MDFIPTPISQSSARSKESRRRWAFLVKLIVFTLIVGSTQLYPSFYRQYLHLPANLVRAALFFISFHLSVSFIRLTLAAVYLRRKPGTLMGNNFLLGLNQISSILNFIILVFAVFLLFNINIKEFFTSISIIAAAIAILFKDYFTNMINGLIIMFSDYLSLNDYVSIGDHRGRIVDITLMNIHLLNDDDELIYIANNNIITSIIVNYTRKNQRKIILEFSLPPDQLTDLNTFEKELADSLEKFGEDIIPESAQMRVVDVNADSVLIKFWVILNRTDRKLDRDIRRTLNSQVINHLNKLNSSKYSDYQGKFL
jgi:small-conductance mechanosensitive channel